MSRVASNQDRAVKQRGGYVYRQQIRVISRKTNGRLMRDETTDYLVTPTPDGTEKELKQVAGRAWVKKRYVEFNKEPGPEPDSLDGDLVHELRDDLANEHSKDGLASDLFPLTTGQQKNYRFELEGEKTVEGRRAWRIHFVPRDKHDIDWAGEALIDCREYQPVRVYTKLSRKLPIFVRNQKGQEEVSKTENVSKGGVAVPLEMELQVGEIVSVECPHTSEVPDILQKAEVRSRATFSFGGRRLYGLKYVR